MATDRLPKTSAVEIRAFLAGKPAMTFSEIAAGMRVSRDSVVNSVGGMFRNGGVLRVSGTGAGAYYRLNTEKVIPKRGSEIIISQKRPSAGSSKLQTAEDFIAAGGKVEVLELGEVSPKERLRKIGGSR